MSNPEAIFEAVMPPLSSVIALKPVNIEIVIKFLVRLPKPFLAQEDSLQFSVTSC